MPQQADSSIGYRFCYIGPDKHGGVDFDFYYIRLGDDGAHLTGSGAETVRGGTVAGREALAR